MNERREERIQLDRIERKLNALCRAIGGPLKKLDLSQPGPAAAAGPGTDGGGAE